MACSALSVCGTWSNAGSRALYGCAVLATLVSCGARGVTLQPSGVMPQDRSNAKAYRVRCNFQGAPDEKYSAAPLFAIGPALYGTTQYGGRYDDGTVFSLHRHGGCRALLHSFRGASDGANPVAGLLSVNGTLYGTTQNGGKYGQGTIFSITADGKERVLHSFGVGGSDGAHPLAGLTFLNGKLLGTTYKGGAYGYGTFFRISLNGVERVLHSFGFGYSDGFDGGYPHAGLIVVNGLLYGTTVAGGRYGVGIIYRVTPQGEELVIYDFHRRLPAARAPRTPLLYFNGTFYGTTGSGGTNDDGTIYSISPNGQGERVLHNFGTGSSDGTLPESGVTVLNGKLYGTTNAGGAGENGTVYGITTTGDETVLHRFGSNYRHDGLNPAAGLITMNGSLYGTTYYGGTSDAGTVFTEKP